MSALASSNRHSTCECPCQVAQCSESIIRCLVHFRLGLQQKACNFQVPWSAAMIKGLAPAIWALSLSAFDSNRRRATSNFPLQAATCRVVAPSFIALSLSAFDSSSRRATSNGPLSAAECRGVAPSLMALSLSALKPNKRRATSKCQC